MIEPDAGNIAAALRNRAAENEAATNLMQSGPLGPEGIAGPDPQMVKSLQQWANATPTLPAGAMLSVAQAHIDPNSDVGNYLIQHAVPALLYKPTSPAEAAGLDLPGSAGYALKKLITDPASLERLKAMPLDQLSNLKANTDGNGEPTLQGIQQAGLGPTSLPDPGDVWSTAISAVREAGAVAQTGLEAVQGGIRTQAAGLGQAISNIGQGEAPTAHSYAGGVPMGPQELKTPSFTLPSVNDLPGPLGSAVRTIVPGVGIASDQLGGQRGGAQINFGGPSELLNPGQLTLVQQAEGKSLGTGILPGGPAVQAAQDAQRAAATVNGHALTPGRALASMITTPDSLQFKALSGVVDAEVALHGDPALLVLGEVSHAIEQAKTIAPITDDALSAVADHVIDRLGPQNTPQIRAWADAHLPTGADVVTREDVQPLLDNVDAVQNDARQKLADAQAAGEDTAPFEKTLVDQENRRNAILDRVSPTSNPDLRQAIKDRIIADPATALPELSRTTDISPRDLAAAIQGRHWGLMHGLYDAVHPTNLLNYMVSDKGEQFFQRMADMGFTDIGHKTNWSMDAKLHLALADAQTSDEARAALQDHIQTIQTVPSLGRHTIANMRWNSVLPTSVADVQDADSLLTRARQDLQLFKVPRAEWDNYLPDVVRSVGNYDDAYSVFRRIGDRNAQSVLSRIPVYQGLAEQKSALDAQVKALGDHIVETPDVADLLDRQAVVAKQVKAHEDLAKNLANYWYTKGNELRLIHNDELGGAHLVAGLAPTEDGMTAVSGAFSPAELLNRGIPTPGGEIQGAIGGERAVTTKDIERAVSTFAPFYNTEFFGVGRKASLAREILVDQIAGRLTKTMKAFVQLKAGAGLRVLASQGAAMAAAGVGDMSENPTGLAGLIAGAGNIDVHGQPLVSDLARMQNKVAARVGQASNWLNELSAEKRTFAGWGTFNPADGSPAAMDAWANRLSYASNQPLPQAIADALANGDPLDAVKESVAHGPLAVERERMAAANVTWGFGAHTSNSSVLADPARSGAWVDAWAQILQQKTGGNTDLLKAIADGGINPKDDRFLRQLENLRKEGFAPSAVTGPIKGDATMRGSLAERARNAMLSVTAAEPTRKWLMIPTASRAYWEQAERMLPHLTPEDASSLRELASAHGVALPNVAQDVTHTISLNQLDDTAKSYAAATLDKVFYNPGRKTILTDQLRDLVPYANIVQSTATRFAKLSAANPRVLRAIQMGVTDATQSGWWSKDQYGKMQMTMVPGEAINSLIGVNTGLTGLANRTNIVFQGLPTAGPAIQMAAPEILGAFGQNDLAATMAKWTNPYGDPAQKGDVINTLFPGWVDAARTTGWFGHVPLLGQTPYQQKMLSQVQRTIFAQQMATGHYNMSDQAQVDRLMADSLQKAKYLYGIRSLANFLSPVSPQFAPNTQLKDGTVLQSYLIAKDWNDMWKANNYDTNKATAAFVNKWGPENIFSAQPMTRLMQYGLPTSSEAEVWSAAHSEFAKQFSGIYGYFAPQGGKFDPTAYLQQIADGTRTVPKVSDWWRLAEARLGNMAWDQFRRTLPPHLNQAQQAVADQYRQTLTDHFPGFNDASLKLPTDTAPQTMQKFRQAIQDPAVKGTPMADAIGNYFVLRDQVLERQKEMGLSAKSISTSGAAADLRQALYAYGSQLAAAVPQFANVWQQVFSYELGNQQTQVTP